MNSFSLIQTEQSSLVAVFISLALILAAVVIGLCCIWRVEKSLKTFLKILTVAVALLALEKLLDITISVHTQNLVTFFGYLDILRSLLFLLAFGEMYRIITGLSRESRDSRVLKK